MIHPPHPIDSPLQAVGNTPLVKLQKVVPAGCADIYVKLEYYNPVVSSDAFASEKLRTMQAFGAELTIEPSEGGKITPDLIPRMMARAEAIAQSEGSYATDQFNNHDSLQGYAAIRGEMIAQLKRPIDGFCGMVGTGGMVMGVATALRVARQPTRIIVMEPATSPIISQGIKGTHGVEGTGAGFMGAEGFIVAVMPLSFLFYLKSV